MDLDARAQALTWRNRHIHCDPPDPPATHAERAPRHAFATSLVTRPSYNSFEPPTRLADPVIEGWDERPALLSYPVVRGSFISTDDLVRLPPDDGTILATGGNVLLVGS